MKHSAETHQLRIARVIRIVVFSSAAVILLGLVLYLVTGESGYENSAFPVNPMLIILGVLALKPYAVMMLGLLLLILTPFLRVSLSVIVFIKEKDNLYVGITALVLVILVVSIVIGITV